MTILMDKYWDAATASIVQLDPLQDVDLIELLLSLPPMVLWYGGRTKGLAFASLRRRAPQLDLGLIRRSFYSAQVELILVREGRSAIDRIGGMPILEELGVVNLESALAVLSGPPASSRASGMSILHERRSLWHALALESWFASRLGMTLGEKR
jgi:hypothetical protein